MPTETNIPTLPTSDFVAYNTKRHYRNGLKVSDVAYPSDFPAEYTYRIGNEKILKLAHFTKPVSQDQYGGYAIAVFCTDGIYMMDVDSTGTGVYTNIRYFSPEVCVNRNTISEIGNGVIFASDKGLMLLTSDGVEEFTPQLNGEISFTPSGNSDTTIDGRRVYRKMVTDARIVELLSSLSTQDFIDYLHDMNTVVSYVSKKKSVVVYNKTKPYIYFINISTRNTTKLSVGITFDDDNSPEETYWYTGTDGTVKPLVFGYRSKSGSTDCLIVSRPIKVQQDDKNSYRVVMTGYYDGGTNNWADLVVMGSLDGDNWRVIGVKEKKLNGGFHNMGCLTERGTWKYLMFIFAGGLTSDSHIDSIDITVEGRYNNKKR